MNYESIDFGLIGKLVFAGSLVILAVCMLVLR
jgi:hypothetical protein